jgi:hypothetical protein
MRSGIDYLVMDKFLLDKERMKPLEEKEDWRRKYIMSEVDKH